MPAEQNRSQIADLRGGLELDQREEAIYGQNLHQLMTEGGLPFEDAQAIALQNVTEARVSSPLTAQVRSDRPGMFKSELR